MCIHKKFRGLSQKNIIDEVVLTVPAPFLAFVQVVDLDGVQFIRVRKSLILKDASSRPVRPGIFIR